MVLLNAKSQWHFNVCLGMLMFYFYFFACFHAKPTRPEVQRAVTDSWCFEYVVATGSQLLVSRFQLP